MWQLTSDITQWQRSEWSARASLPCLAAVAIPLALGLWWHDPRLGMIAASGAMSVGFGAFHRLGRSNLGPMLLASVAMSVSTLVGSLVSHSVPQVVAVTALWGFGYGLLGVFGAAVSWTVLQWVVFLVIVGSNAYPVDAHQAIQRAALTLAGGLLQTLLVIGLSYLGAAVRRYRGVILPPGSDRDQGTPLPAWKPRGSDFQFAWRLAFTLGATTAAYRYFGLPNGDWIPMTAAIVMKSDFHQTASRGLGRLAGTLLGSGLATLLASELRPDPAVTAMLIVLFSWLCYTLLRVNYTLYAACITSYVVFLFAFIGLPGRAVVVHRVENTALGGLCALLSYLSLQIFWRRRSHVPAATTGDDAR